MVYVDHLRSWPQAPKPGSERHFGNGKRSAHLMADTHAELHAFARRLGLQRRWFQEAHGGHYDLVPAKHALALRYGAELVRVKPEAGTILRQTTLFDKL